MPKVALGAEGMVAQIPSEFSNFAVISSDHPPFAGGDDFVAIEAKGSSIPQAAGAPSLVFSAVGLSGILDYGDATLLPQSHQRVHIDRMTVDVNRDNGLGTRGDLGSDLLNIHLPVVCFVIDQH